MVGLIRSRLLVNALVDPDEAAKRLPAGMQPHVVDGQTVVGCCLLDVETIRPQGWPALAGVRVRAAAHRISAEWVDPKGERVVGVYIPGRVSSSHAARAVGGRAFPGVYRAATTGLVDSGQSISWSVAPRWVTDFGLRVTAVVAAGEASETCEPIGGTCLDAVVGLSPGRDGALEGARMKPTHRRALPVDLVDLDSPFLDTFASVRAAPSYLMRDVPVVWSPSPQLVTELVVAR
jgi:hypothetical protein